MEDLNEINKISPTEDYLDDLSLIAFNDLFTCFTEGNPTRIMKMEGTEVTIKEMLDHFAKREEYEKCSEIILILKKINKSSGF